MSMASPPRGTPIRSISAVLPAYNEAANIVQVVEATLDALHDAVPDFEIIIVDDGSVDATARFAADLAARHANVQVVRHARKRGYGSAWRSGIEAASRQYILFMDADRQYDPADIARLVQWGDTYDLVAGFRQPRNDPFLRLLLAFCFRIMVRLLFGVKARDVTCGFMLARAGFLKPLAIYSTGIAVITEIHYRACRLDASTREVGVRQYRRASKQSGARPRVLLRTIIELVAFWRRVRRERREARADAAEEPREDA
jgi:glycosyltransferase involved in cell wall biosynthesis